MTCLLVWIEEMPLFPISKSSLKMYTSGHSRNMQASCLLFITRGRALLHMRCFVFCTGIMFRCIGNMIRSTRLYSDSPRCISLHRVCIFLLTGCSYCIETAFCCAGALLERVVCCPSGCLDQCRVRSLLPRGCVLLHWCCIMLHEICLMAHSA